MSDLRIDLDNELVLENGDLVLTTSETDNIAQNIRQRLRVLKGEWFLDRTLGLPYFETILEKNPNSVLVATLFKQTILETRGVTKLNTFSMTYDNNNLRELVVTFEATITTGDILYFEEQI